MTEALARKIAHKMGLERHVIPGVYFTIQNPVLPREEMCEELWNGHVKIYKKLAKEKDPTLTGILEPFLTSPQKAITADDFADMTFTAFLLGLRDGKSDGKFGAQLVDVEEIMPVRLLPGPKASPNKSVAATHLPFLSEPLAMEPISEKKLEEFAKAIEKIDGSLEELITYLEGERIGYADHVSEALEIVKKRSHLPKNVQDPSRGVDHGGFIVQAIQQEQIMEKHPTVNVAQTDLIMSEAQLVAFSERVKSLKKYIDRCVQEKQLPTSFSIVKNSDLLYGAHFSAFTKYRQKEERVAPNIVGFYPPLGTALLATPDRAVIIKQSLEAEQRNLTSRRQLVFEAKESVK